MRALLAKAPASEDELDAARGRAAARLKHNCSGKHAGMLALCRARAGRREGYRLAGPSGAGGMLAEHAEAAEVPATSIRRAVDGCGVVTFALPLERMAHAFARLASLEGGERVAAGDACAPRPDPRAGRAERG